MEPRMLPRAKDINGFSYVGVLPYLYRYEDERWIDDFFDNGNLYLSCFMNYMKYSDNQLGDTGEGHNVQVEVTVNQKTLISVNTLGLNCYSFCTSTILDRELLTTFSRNSVFRIFDPGNFMFELNQCIPDLLSVYYGNCIYVKERSDIKKNADALDDSLDFEKIKQRIQGASRHTSHF